MKLQACFHTDDKSYSYKVIQKAFSVSGALSENTKPHDQALGKRIWDEQEIFWNCDTSYPWLTTEQIDNLIKAAFLEPSLLTPLKITKKNRRMADAHIKISWLKKSEDSNLTSNSDLAYAWGPGRGLGGNIVMNADVLWLLRTTPLLAKEAKDLGYIENYADPNNKIKFFDPLHTLKHEGGHAVGMNHITDLTQKLKAVLYPFYNGLRIFGPADVSYLTLLYGSVPNSPQIMSDINTRIENLYRN